MRGTWDALARADTSTYVGDPARASTELASLFGRLSADPRGGTCVEVGCGPGRMTSDLAARFDRVVAVDVSPEMLERARAAVASDNVDFRLVSGEQLDGVEDESADVLVCYLVLQHLPRRRLVEAYFREFGRVLRRDGEAFVQLPVFEPSAAAAAWRLLRNLAGPFLALSSRPERAAALRGVRLTERELGRALPRAGLETRARDYGPDAPYRFSRDVFLRLARA
jgi:SAM-dependent methyltransferase